MKAYATKISLISEIKNMKQYCTIKIYQTNISESYFFFLDIGKKFQSSKPNLSSMLWSVVHILRKLKIFQNSPFDISVNNRKHFWKPPTYNYFILRIILSDIRLMSPRKVGRITDVSNLNFHPPISSTSLKLTAHPCNGMLTYLFNAEIKKQYLSDGMYFLDQQNYCLSSKIMPYDQQQK